MKLLTAIPAVLLLCTTITQAQTQNNIDNPKLVQTNAYLMHSIEARQTARLNAAHSTAAKTTDDHERLIAHSLYYGTTFSDSASYIYSGDRSSTFDFNSMQYELPYFANVSLPMNMSVGNLVSQITNQDHNFGSDVLFDSSWAITPSDTNLLLAQYDANNNIIQYYDPYLNNPAVNISGTRSINTYDANGNITSILVLNWAAGAWDTATKRIVTYNGNMITSDTSYMKQTVGFASQFAYDYSYDNNGNLTVVNIYFKNNTVWENMKEYAFYYNPDNTIQKDTLFTSSSNGAPLVLAATDSVGYAAGVNYITYEQVKVYSVGYTTATTYMHVTGGLPDTVYYTFDQVPNQVESAAKTSYTYDSYNNPLVASQYDADGSGIYSTTPDAIDYYYYQQYTTAVKNVVKQNVNITVYPNPTTNEINISETGIQQGARTYITLINALGQTVHSESLPWMGNTQTISLGGLVPGNYWLMVQDKGGNVLSRQTIVKR